MQYIKYLLCTLIFLSVSCAYSQFVFLPEGDKQQHLTERMEVLSGTDSILNFSKTRPLNRKNYIAAALNKYAVNSSNTTLGATDKYNFNSLLSNNTPFISDSLYNTIQRPGYHFLKKFYLTPANFYEVRVKDFNMVINPVLQLGITKERNNNQRLFINSRGIQVYGNIADKIGFYTSLTENQERAPLYVQQWTNERMAIPGAGNYKEFNAAGGTDYFDARGYFTATAAKYINISFGYDKNFIGNGYRSLILSEFAPNQLFLKLNTRIWKLNYQNIFMELHNARNTSYDRLLGRKYAAMHHLDFAATPWLNVGVFESVIFGRPNKFDFSYLNPLIFYRSVEMQNGSPDNVLLGADIKANLFKKVQVYGQLLLDEFRLKEMTARNGWWANKWAIQAGAKYMNVAGINNLDIQLEYNILRPFTYSHTDSVANYTHYNQPLAHPLMANFKEWIAIVRYQPLGKLYFTGKLMYYIQGRDSSNLSYGSNIFLPNTPDSRNGDYGYYIGSGWKTRVLMGSLLASYELLQNMFVDVHINHRKFTTTTPPLLNNSGTQLNLGFRWNMHRRNFDF